MGRADLPGNLESTDTLFVIEHLPEHFEPYLEMNVGVLKDGAYCHREAVSGPLGLIARFADPMPRTRAELVDFGVPAARALYASRPAALHEELLASIIIREGFHQLFKCHHNGNRIA